MSDPNAPPLDEQRIVRVLDAHGVEYVLVGMLGARMRGATKQTKDFDLCPATTRENLGRMAAALDALQARLRIPGVPDGVAVRIDAVFLAQMEISTWRTDAGDLDVVRGIPSGTMTHLREFSALLPAADLVEVAGCRIYVASLEDIIASKETTNRPPDHEALPELRALRAAQLAEAAYPEGMDPAPEQTSPGPPAEPQSRSPRPHDDRDPPGRSMH